MDSITPVYAEMARKFISESVPKDSKISEQELDAIVGVCMMGVHRTGREDPKAMLKVVSDGLIEHMVKNLKRASGHPALAKSMQFFLLEWCWRNDYLNDDWRWEWTSANQGKIHFNARLPLSAIPVPSD